MTPPPYSDPNASVFIDTESDAGAWARELAHGVAFPVINHAGGKLHREVATPDHDGFIPFHTPENTYERT